MKYQRILFCFCLLLSFSCRKESINTNINGNDKNITLLHQFKNVRLTNSEFLNEKVGFLTGYFLSDTGGSTMARLLITIDSAKTWRETTFNNEYHAVKSLFPKDANNIYGILLPIGGTSNDVATVSNDGGKSWNLYKISDLATNASRYQAIAMLDNATGVVVGDEAKSIFSSFFDCYGVIYTTNDGGKTWRNTFKTPENKNINFTNVIRLRSGSLMVFGFEYVSPGVQKTLIYTSSDGLRWTALPNNLTGLFITPNNVRELSDGTIMTVTNTYELKSDSTYSIKTIFVNSADQGKTWDTLYIHPVYNEVDFSFITRNIGTYLNGIPYLTSDAMATAKELSFTENTEINTVSMISVNKIYFGSKSGKLYLYKK